MNFDEIKELESKYLAQTYRRLPVAISSGRGMYLYDFDGNKYLDMFAGVATSVVGHSHPRIVDVIKKQADLLMHTSDWVYTYPQVKLAGLLTQLTGMDKTFFTNDGTGAVETAIKLALKVTGKEEIIAMKQGFHGRTLGSLSLTYGEKFRNPVKPLLFDAKFVDFNNVDAVRNAITPKTAAVIVEPIQGESGVILPDNNYLKELRELTSEKDVLLIVDEVQTGWGRTGKLFAYQHAKIKPDILCLAKALGGGFPVGATLFHGFDFSYGDHGSTMGGNPLACAVALATIDVILDEDLVKNSADIGDYLLESLLAMGLNARGKGLMIGIDVDNAQKTVLDLIKEKILTIYSEPTVRVLPPLIINKKQADQFLNAIGKLNL